VAHRFVERHAVQRWQMGDGFIFASPDAGAQIFWAADLNGRVMAVSWAEPLRNNDRDQKQPRISNPVFRSVIPVSCYASLCCQSLTL
jgi:hypothetical protein